MRRKGKGNRIVLIALLLGASRADAQGLETLVLTQPGSTRAMALGNAFVFGSPDSDATFYNPAFAEQLRGISGALQWVPGDGQNTRMISFSGGAEWWGGGVALGVRAMNYEAVRPGGLGGAIAASGLAAGVSHARRLFGVRVGATAKIVEQRFLIERSAVPAFDVGAGLPVSFLLLGLAVQDIGPDLDFDAAFVDEDLPGRVTFNAATRSRPTGPLDLLAAASFSTEFDGDVTAGAGIEAAYWPISGRTFFGRVGGLRDPAGDVHLTAGAGFNGDRISLDYTFWSRGDGVHRVGVRWR